jgi:hypothetical protein
MRGLMNRVASWHDVMDDITKSMARAGAADDDNEVRRLAGELRNAARAVVDLERAMEDLRKAEAKRK